MTLYFPLFTITMTYETLHLFGKYFSISSMTFVRATTAFFKNLFNVLLDMSSWSAAAFNFAIWISTLICLRVICRMARTYPFVLCNHFISGLMTSSPLSSLCLYWFNLLAFSSLKESSVNQISENYSSNRQQSVEESKEIFFLSHFIFSNWLKVFCHLLNFRSQKSL